MSDNVDIMSAIRQIAAERKIDVDDIIDAIKQAVLTVYKKGKNIKGSLENAQVEFDPENGNVSVYLDKEIVKKAEDNEMQISLTDAKQIDKSLKIGGNVLVDVTPEGDFGRIAAQTSRQVILQKLREAEKEASIRQVENLLGTIENVIVQSIDSKTGNVICEINKARAIMSRDARIPNEYYRIGSRIKVLLEEVDEDPRGKYIKVSRAAPEFLAELFKLEVPEIDSGSIEIVGIAREAGSRSKVAVRSNAEGIDPIGSCVGQKGVRINSITNELRFGKFEEKIDIILWDEEIEAYLMNAVLQMFTLTLK